MGHSQALMMVGSPHEEHQIIMDAKVNDLRTTLCIVCALFGLPHEGVQCICGC